MENAGEGIYIYKVRRYFASSVEFVEVGPLSRGAHFACVCFFVDMAELHYIHTHTYTRAAKPLREREGFLYRTSM